MSGKRRAIFLDRDGTLNEPVGFVNHESRFRLFPYAADAVRALKDEGYLAVVVTNQSGRGRGLFDASVMEAVHAKLGARLGEAGAALDGLYVCPHAPGGGCECRKPKPGLLLRAADELSIDLEASWIVGDSYSDLEAGWAAGTRSALVRTGSGEGALRHDGDAWPRKPDLVSPDLHQAVCAILWGEVPA